MPRNEGKSAVVVYKGTTFRRYPGSLRWADRNYFRPNVTHKRRGVEALHREIWKDAYGPIPEGYEIHHKDHNPLNNALDNLECLSQEQHFTHHADGRTLEEMRVKREWVEQIRAKASNWHKSEEGRAWHRQLARFSAAARYKVSKTCEQCGAAYEVDNIAASKSRFCSNACKSAARRHAGVDLVTGACEACGASFQFNRYQPSRYCSGACRSEPRKRREARICPNCGSSFEVRPSERQRYCTLACAYAHMYR